MKAKKQNDLELSNSVRSQTKQLSPAELSQAEWFKLIWAESSWVKLSQAESSLVKLSQAELSWAELNWA